MSSLSRDEVAKLAAPARIEMTEDELVNLASQFGSILDAVARVQELNLGGVKATSHPQPMENIFREDLVQPSLTPDQALSGAPAKEEERFRVPQILGEAE
jgi:aspartyl-tRNA(Asn)/glutamyl-tRNA(Gln) amidotransferase subunit C